MKKSVLAVFLAPFFLSLASADEVVPWHPSLCLANGGYWPERIGLTVTNSAAEDLNGQAFALAVPALASSRVEGLRVCRPDGVELLFEVRDANSQLSTRGTRFA